MDKPRTIFLGTPEEAILILKAVQEMQWPVVGVYTAPDRRAGRGKAMLKSPVKNFAEENQLNVISPEDMGNEKTINELKRMEPDLIVLAAYGKLLPGRFLKSAKLGAINVHPSILPIYRGAIPVQAAILSGDIKTGASLMLMDEGLDTGPLIAQSEIALTGNETAPELSLRLFGSGTALLKKFGPAYINGQITATPQSVKHSPWRRLKKESGVIDWSKSALQLEREVRAYKPWPGTYSYWRGSKIDVLEAAIDLGSTAPVGKVIEIDQKVGIATAEGTLLINKIKMEGKSELSINEFLRGQPEFMGAILPS